MIPGALVAASKATTSSHPLWHYLIIPAIGVVLYACITVPAFVRSLTRRREEARHDTGK